VLLAARAGRRRSRVCRCRPVVAEPEPEGDGEAAIGLARRPGTPRCVRYWSVVDDRFELVAMFDAFLFEERVSRDRSEKRTGRAKRGVKRSQFGHAQHGQNVG
jgi:hypothetical protein